MKSKGLFFACIAALSALTLSVCLFAPKAATSLTRADLTKTSYTLDITDLSSDNQTLTTSKGNPIAFEVVLFENGAFKAGALIRNETALSGLESVTVAGMPEGSFLTVSYGWWGDDWDVTDGVIDSFHPTYDFGGECPSFFVISSPADVMVTSISLAYSCVASPEPSEYALSFMEVGETEYCVSRCKYGATSIVIPSSYKGLPVTSIGEYAFCSCSSLASLFFGPSLISIGDYAFAYCASLAEVAIPENAISIGEHAFEDCTSLTSITIPSSLTSIGDYAFYGCSSLTSVAITSAASIGDYAFSCCPSLTSVAIAFATSIGSFAFEECSSLTSIAIPSSVTSIGYSAFSFCSSLACISVDPGNPVYDSRGGCNAIIETSTNTLVVGCMSTTIPSSLTSIGDCAFCGCSSLTSLSLGASVVSIGKWAFFDCSSLVSISFGSAVTSIGNNAFYYCSSITSIILPSSVIYIGGRAFGYCSSLASVFFDGTTSQWESVDRGSNYLSGTQVTEIVCTDGTVSV